MPETCNCGAQLPPDALFCHKCGKPQKEIVIPEPAPPPLHLEPEVMPVARLEARPLDMHNRLAMRVALVAALIATLLSFVPYLNWLAAGFFAVVFYRRRTGDLLNMESGVRLGWITGVMTFAMMALLLTLSMVMFRAAGGAAAFQAQFKNAVDTRFMEALKVLQSGPDLVKLLVELFFFTTFLSMAGGALGTKIGARRNS